MNSTQNDGLSRRGFLIASTTAAGAALALGPNLFAEVGEVKRWAVGYVPLDGLSDDGAFAPNMTDGRRIAASDPQLREQGARVRILGIAGLSAQPAERRAHAVFAHFAIRGEGGQRLLVPYQAWMAGRFADSTGNPVAFYVPLDVDDRVRLSILTASPKPAPAGQVSRRSLLARPETSAVQETVIDALPVTLSLSGGRGTVKLIRGYYVITPLFEGQSVPDWRRLQLRGVNGGCALHEARGGKVVPVDFEHVVLSVNSATIA